MDYLINFYGFIDSIKSLIEVKLFSTRFRVFLQIFWKQMVLIANLATQNFLCEKIAIQILATHQHPNLKLIPKYFTTLVCTQQI